MERYKGEGKGGIEEGERKRKEEWEGLRVEEFVVERKGGGKMADHCMIRKRRKEEDKG